jgi:hypothetical protein
MAIKRKLTIALFGLAIGLGAAECANAAETDNLVGPAFERIGQLRIFFGHQSVGENLLDGLKQLAKTSGAAINIAETQTASTVKPGTLGHFLVGENRKPLQKLEAFERAMGERSSGIDIALMKFCYLDISAETDVKALFSSYRATADKIRAKHPGTLLVHVTAPLTTVRNGPKEFVKKLFGRAPYGAVENQLREEYNNLLRQAYQGREPVFDLARIESTTADGSAVNSEWKGQVAPTLASLNTDDGGHLNDTGRLRAARELLSILASVSRRP